MTFDPEAIPFIPCAVCMRPMPMRHGAKHYENCTFPSRLTDGDSDSGAVRSGHGIGVHLRELRPIARDVVLASIGAVLLAAALSSSITRNVAIAGASSGDRHVAPAGSAASVGRRIVFHVESGR